MARPTLTDILISLAELNATFNANIATLRANIERVDGAHSKTAEALAEISKLHAVLEERLNELKKVYEEAEPEELAHRGGVRRIFAPLPWEPVAHLLAQVNRPRSRLAARPTAR